MLIGLIYTWENIISAFGCLIMMINGWVKVCIFIITYFFAFDWLWKMQFWAVWKESDTANL